MATSNKDFSFDLPVNEQDEFVVPISVQQLKLIKNLDEDLYQFLLTIWSAEKNGLVLVKLYSLTVKENILNRDFLAEKRLVDTQKINAIIDTSKKLNMSIPDVLAVLAKVKTDNLQQLIDEFSAQTDGESQTKEVINEIVISISKLIENDRMLSQKENALYDNIVSIIMSRYGKWQPSWNVHLPVVAYNSIIDFYFGEQGGWDSDSTKKS